MLYYQKNGDLVVNFYHRSKRVSAKWILQENDSEKSDFYEIINLENLFQEDVDDEESSEEQIAIYFKLSAS